MNGPKETIQLTKDIIPESASFGVKISGDSMEPEFEDGQIAWVLKQDMVKNGEIGIFSLNGEAYIKKLQDSSFHAYTPAPMSYASFNLVFSEISPPMVTPPQKTYPFSSALSKQSIQPFSPDKAFSYTCSPSSAAVARK